MVPILRITVGNLDVASTKFHLVGSSNPVSLGQEERRSKISLTTPIIGERRGRVRDGRKRVRERERQTEKQSGSVGEKTRILNQFKQ